MLARAKGLNMWIEYYPYDAASTAIGSEQLASLRLEGALGYKYKDVLYDPTRLTFALKIDALRHSRLVRRCTWTRSPVGYCPGVYPLLTLHRKTYVARS